MNDEAQQILDKCRTIAVVGLSSKPWRASHGVSAYMQSQGYRIIPVNPTETDVLGEKAYRDLASVPEPVDLVNVFRNSSHAPAIVQEAIDIGAKAVWLQEGVVSEEAQRLAREAGLLYVEDKCLFKVHRFR